MSKEAPYFPSAAGFGEDDAAWLEAQGFDAVRLGLTGTGLMPFPGHVDEQFLDHLAETVDVLAAHLIFVLLIFVLLDRSASVRHRRTSGRPAAIPPAG